MPPVAELRALAQEEPLDRLTDRALHLLGSAETVAAEPHAPADALAALRGEWEALEASTRGAWARYPEFHDTGAHGMRQDARAIELFATITYLARSGIYRPEELDEIQRRDEGAGPWVAREALRLRVLLVCLERLIMDLDRGEVSPFAYAGAIRELALRIGRTEVASP